MPGCVPGIPSPSGLWRRDFRRQLTYFDPELSTLSPDYLDCLNHLPLYFPRLYHQNH